MATQHVVVDGSNIATEGRSTPSLAQLEAAVAELRKEFPESELTVVVDATFAHRIDPSELERFEQAALRGEFVYPPAGAIGRGDAFLLRIAERVDGIVLSNDSFQEFHGEHEWLFERGRLLGATPVPGVGWIFIPRTPVRGPRSRVAVRDANRAKERVVKAIAQATKEVVEPTPEAEKPADARRARGRAAQGQSPQAVNDPMTFISFIADHPLGDQLEGIVDSFTSHGAVVHLGEVRCYVPLSGLGDPAPRSAREVLHRGETRTFVVTALDPFRRGVELALPGVGVVSGRPTDETVAAEVRMARAPASTPHAGRRRRAAADAASVQDPSSDAPTSGNLEEIEVSAPRARAIGVRRSARGGTKAVAKSTRSTPKPAAEPVTKQVAGIRVSGRASRGEDGTASTQVSAARATRTGAAKTPSTRSTATKLAPATVRSAKGTPQKAAGTKSAASNGRATKAAPAAAKTTAPRNPATKTAAPTKTSPTKTSPTKTSPTKTAATKAAATKAAATKAAATKAAATKAAATKAAATKTSPTKTTAKRVATTKAEPITAGPPRRSPSKTTARTATSSPAVARTTRAAASRVATGQAAVAASGGKPRTRADTAPSAPVEHSGGAKRGATKATGGAKSVANTRRGRGSA